MMGWAIAGAIALPALIGGCAVVLAGILVKRRPSAPTAPPPAKRGAAPAHDAAAGESVEELQRQFHSSTTGEPDRRLALGRKLIASLVGAGRHPEAAGVFKDCLGLDPAFALADAEEVLPIANAARAAGDAKTAVAALRGFDRKYPGHSLLPDVYVFSAKLMADDLGNTEVAKKMLKHVTERYPEHPLSSEAKRALEAMG